ncbi:MAG: hypothetical protein AB7G08_30040 [Hyphomicrobiaceae bacterium]
MESRHASRIVRRQFDAGAAAMLKGLASASGNTTEARDAELMLVIGDQLRAGYQGYFKCRA